MQCMKRQATNNEIKSLSCKQRRFMDLRCNLWTPKYFLIKLNNKQNEIWDFISTASLIVFDVCIWYSARWTVRFIVLYMLYGVVLLRHILCVFFLSAAPFLIVFHFGGVERRNKSNRNLAQIVFLFCEAAKCSWRLKEWALDNCSYKISNENICLVHIPVICS